MKVCKYCHTECDETTKKCPSCGSNDFNHKCANCGTEHSSAFCPNCGIKFDAKKHICPTCGNSFYTNACPSCGYTINKSSSKEKETSIPNTATSTVYVNTQPKKKKNTWITVLLWIFFFPIMVFVAIWKSKMSQKTKIILTAILALIFLIAGLFPSDETETVAPPPESPSQNIHVEQNESNELGESSSIVETSEYEFVDNFINNYNSISNTPIVDAFEIDINDKEGGYYRTEFRLLAFENAPSKCGSLGNGTIEIINYDKENIFGGNGSLRLYINVDDYELVKEVLETSIKVLNMEISEEDIQDLYSSWEEGFSSSFLLGDIQGVFFDNNDHYEVMFDLGAI